MARVAITDAVAKAAKAEAGKRTEIADLTCRGLALRVTPDGNKTWAFRYRDANGRDQRLTLGRYPDLGLRDARLLADRHRAAAALGQSPAEEKRRAREEAPQRTFAHLAERYLKEHAEPRKRSADGDRRLLERHVLPSWKDRPYPSITRRDVADLLHAIASKGKGVTANRVRALLSKLFRFAIGRGLLDTTPVVAIDKPVVEKARERNLSDEEIRLLWKLTEADHASSRVPCMALRLALCTGLRAGEIAGLALSEVRFVDDPQRAMIVLPPERTKSGRAFALPLVGRARTIIAAAITWGAAISEEGPAQEWVFPARYANAGSLKPNSLAHVMGRFPTRMDLDAKARSALAGEPGAASWRASPPSPHDLRRTAATRLRALGVPSSTVRLCLNHAPAAGDVLGRHYDVSDGLSEKRRALSLWDAALTAILERREHDAVVIDLARRG